MLSRFSCVRLCATLGTAALGTDSLGKNTGVGCHFLLQHRVQVELTKGFPDGSDGKEYP